MKRNIHKIVTFILLAAAPLVVSSCVDLSDKILALLNRVTEAESLVNITNININALYTTIKAIEQNDHITGIDEIKENGIVVGYVISFTSGYYVNIYNGQDGTTPIIGIQQNTTNGYYYWTIQKGTSSPTWMTNSFGQRVRATGTIPKLKIESGYWWVSYDDGSSWSRVSQATGEQGSSVFKDIDYSDPYFVRFTLSNGVTFTIPTQRGFEELSAYCDNINTNINSCMDIYNTIDTTLFVESVSELSRNGKFAGYAIKLKSGKVYELYSGFDGTKKILLGIKYNPDLSSNCWTIKIGETGTENWLMSDGKVLTAQPDDLKPSIGIKDSSGVYYFTIKYGNGEPQWIVDAEGNPVRASMEILISPFKSIEILEYSVLITMANDHKISILKARRGTPSMTISIAPRKNHPDSAQMTFDAVNGYYVPGIVENEDYFFEIKVRDTLFNHANHYLSFVSYLGEANISVTAFAIDNGYIKNIVPDIAKFDVNTVYISGQQRFYYDSYFGIVYHSGPKDVVKHSRIAVFLKWNGEANTTMKVIELKNKNVP
jgi:hypothetical protein